jgi:tRNA-2-methylthio-N6-dimethylallyladenosine synthase
VPYTRGRERSRDAHSIVAEAQDLFDKGYREVTLLGQNVDSYKWDNDGNLVNFANLLEKVAVISPLLRIRFSTSHPKDITDQVLEVMKQYDNICKYIHLPAQSGSSEVLKAMNRTYNREWYLDRVAAIRRILGDDCAISTDMIAGFCGETEDQHQETLSLMAEVKYDFAYMFAYSERPGTPAAKKLTDDIDAVTKQRRLAEIIAVQSQNSLQRNQQWVGKEHLVLVEGFSKRSDDFLSGRIDQNAVCIFPKQQFKKGDYVKVKVYDCTPATLFGEVVQD